MCRVYIHTTQVFFNLLNTYQTRFFNLLIYFVYFHVPQSIIFKLIDTVTGTSAQL